MMYHFWEAVRKCGVISTLILRFCKENVIKIILKNQKN